jgi:hypothetical protein
MTVHELTRRRRSVSFRTSWLSRTLESLSRIALCALAAGRSADGVVASYRQLFRPLCGGKSGISTVCVRFCAFFYFVLRFPGGLHSTVSIATSYGLNGSVFEPRGWRDFPHASRPVLTTDYSPDSGYRVSFPGVGAWRYPLTPM